MEWDFTFLEHHHQDLVRISSHAAVIYGKSHRPSLFSVATAPQLIYSFSLSKTLIWVKWAMKYWRKDFLKNLWIINY